VVFLTLAGVMSLVIAGGAAASIDTVHALDNSFGRIQSARAGQKCDPTVCVQIQNNDPRCFTKVCNYLVLGVDSRAGLTKSEEAAAGNVTGSSGERNSDTMMLVHLNLVKNHTTIVSIPRDLYVDIPGYGYNKINSAYSHGPGVVVKTVEKLTGMPINHYVAVNFAGFEGVVNAIGGVTVCIDKPMIDTLAHLDLAKAGCYKLEGTEALSFVRARHVQGDLIPDFSRIERQQVFFRAMLNKMISAGSLFHIRTLFSAIKHNVTIDQKLNVYTLQDLLNRLDSVGQTGVDFRAVPAVPFTQNGIDYVRALQPETTELFNRIKNDQPLYQLGKALPLTGMSPATVRVQVFDLNSGGKAQQVASYLSRAGFNVVGVQPAPEGVGGSEIRWAPDEHEQLRTLLRYIHHVKRVQGSTFGPGGTIVVVVGPGFPPQTRSGFSKGPSPSPSATASPSPSA
jgi:LCP family protein required for cell wall assembly